MINDKLFKIFFIFCFFFYFLIGSFWVIFSPSNLTEEVNIYAGQLVYQGQMPGDDFQYHQRPLWPFLYGWLGKIFGANLYGSRIGSLFLGLLILLFTFFIAQKLKGQTAGLIALGLITFNPLVIQQYILNPIICLNVLLMVLLIYLWLTKIRFDFKIILSLIIIFTIANTSQLIKWGFKLALFILIFGLIVWLFYLLIQWLKTRLFLKINRLWIYFVFFLGLMIFLLLLNTEFIPYFLINGLRHFFSLVVLLLLIIFLSWSQCQKHSFDSLWGIFLFFSLFIFFFILIYLRHLDILSRLMPLLAILVSLGLVKMREEIQEIRAQSFFNIFLMTVIIFSPLIQKDLVEQIQISRLIPAQAYISQVADFVKTYSQLNEKILTFSPAIALMAQRNLLAGLEEGEVKTKIVLVALKNKEVGTVILTDKYFYRKMMGREEELELIKEGLLENYYLAKEFNFPARFGFKVKGDWGYQGLKKAEIYLPFDSLRSLRE